jgi:hypothetical protein
MYPRRLQPISRPSIHPHIPVLAAAHDWELNQIKIYQTKVKPENGREPTWVGERNGLCLLVAQPPLDWGNGNEHNGAYEANNTRVENDGAFMGMSLLQNV